MISSDFRAVYDASSQAWPEDAKTFCLTLLAAFDQLEGRVKKLEDQAAITSHNSSLPPSKNGFKKPVPAPKSLRQKTGKRPGGQAGHVGQGGKLKNNPDQLFVHRD